MSRKKPRSRRIPGCTRDERGDWTCYAFPYYRPPYRDCQKPERFVCTEDTCDCGGPVIAEPSEWGSRERHG